MRIIIDYNGSIAQCKLQGWLPDPDDKLPINVNEQISFKQANIISQIFAMDAFKTIMDDWKREERIRKHTKVKRKL